MLGGRCLAERRTIDGQPAADWAAQAIAELRSMPEVRLLPRTTVFGVFDDGVYGAVERVNDHLPVPPPFEPRQRVWRIVAKQSVLASGSIERPLVFGNNDLPGVMLAGAVRTYVNRYAVLPGKRAVVFTDNDDGWTTAADLLAAGAQVAAIVDSREPIVVSELARRYPNVEAIAGEVNGARGGRHVESVEVTSRSGTSRRIDCDLVAMSGGWSPTLHLTSHKGHRPRWDEDRAIFVPDKLPAGMRVAGAANGDLTLGEAILTGYREGLAAAAACGHTGSMPALPRIPEESTRRVPLWRVARAQGKCFLDFQNDVTADDVELAEREGFRSVEHAKRYTTLGMATDQGKTSNVNGIALLAKHRSRSIADDRHDHVPSALHTHRHGRDGRAPPRHGLPPDPLRTVASVGQRTRRFVHRERSMAARAVVPPPRRNGLVRTHVPRSEGRALRRWPVRCVHARQDRRAGPGRAQVHRTALRQQLRDAGRRPHPLRHHAARGRFHVRRRHGRTPRRESLPDHDHDGARGAGLPAHAPVPPDAVARTRRAVRVGHRPVGAVRGGRSALA